MPTLTSSPNLNAIANGHLWTRSDGAVVDIHEMADEHIANCASYLERTARSAEDIAYLEMFRNEISARKVLRQRLSAISRTQVPTCDRCGNRAYGNAYTDSVTGLVYCDICHDDLFG